MCCFNSTMEHASAHHELPCSHFWGWVLSHGCAGVMLTAAGLWWTGNVFYNWHTSATPSGGQPFRNQMSYPGPIRALPVEGWCFLLVMVTLATIFGICGLLASTMFGVLHVPVFLGFAAFGMAQLLTHHKVALPEGLDVAMFVVAFFLKAFVTYTHLDGTASPVILAHSYLVLNETMIIFATLLERFFRDSVVCSLARPYLVMVDGSWLIYVAVRFSGCSLASLKFEMSRQSMYMTATFTWLYLTIAVVLLLLAWLARPRGFEHLPGTYKVLESEVA